MRDTTKKHSQIPADPVRAAQLSRLTHPFSGRPDNHVASTYFSVEQLPRELGGVITAFARTVSLGLESERLGTGFFLSGQRLLTCHHVVERLTRDAPLEEGSILGLSYRTSLKGAFIEKDNLELDYSIIRIPGLGDDLEFPPVEQPTDCLGETCFFIGNPTTVTAGRPDPGKNAGQLVSVGQIEAYASPNIEVFGPTLNPGNSGGPILTRNGRCLGIVAEQYGSGGRGPSIIDIMADAMQA